MKEYLVFLIWMMISIDVTGQNTAALNVDTHGSGVMEPADLNKLAEEYLR